MRLEPRDHEVLVARRGVQGEMLQRVSGAQVDLLIIGVRVRYGDTTSIIYDRSAGTCFSHTDRFSGIWVALTDRVWAKAASTLMHGVFSRGDSLCRTVCLSLYTKGI